MARGGRSGTGVTGGKRPIEAGRERVFPRCRLCCPRGRGEPGRGWGWAGVAPSRSGAWPRRVRVSHVIPPLSYCSTPACAGRCYGRRLPWPLSALRCKDVHGRVPCPAESGVRDVPPVSHPPQRPAGALLCALSPAVSLPGAGEVTAEQRTMLCGCGRHAAGIGNAHRCQTGAFGSVLVPQVK